MDKRYALILAFLLTALIGSTVFLFSGKFQGKEKESVLIVRVIDGDTVVLKDGRTLRLNNINAPEKKFYNSNASKEFLSSYLNQEIFLEEQGYDKYRRVLAKLYSDDKYLNLELVELGLASKFLVDPEEAKIFAEAENKSISLEKGIWKKSAYFGCFKSSIDTGKEEVILENSCHSINLNGWTLKDESRKVYKFKNISIGRIKLHSKKGNDNSTDLFWGQSSPDIWNNDQDSIYLFDSRGQIAHYETYGY